MIKLIVSGFLGVVMFSVAFFLQIIFIPRISPADLLWYYIIWACGYIVGIVLIFLRRHRRY